MSEHPPDRFWSGIDITKLVAGTLAAVSAAVVGSFLGVAGTLVGAAVASLVGGLGTELYAKSLERGVSRLKGQPVQPPVTAPAAVGTPPVATPSTAAETPGHFDPVPQAGATKPRRPRWQLVAAPALVFFALAMGVLFAVESIAGQSVPSMVGKESSRSTTIGSTVGVGKKSQPAPAPTQTSSTENQEEAPAGDPTATPEPDADATAGPTPDATGTAPVETQEPAPTAEPTAGSGDTPPGDGDTQQQDSTTDDGGTGGQEGVRSQQAPQQEAPQLPEAPQAPAGAPASR